jgi:hypothetical protein
LHTTPFFCLALVFGIASMPAEAEESPTLAQETMGAMVVSIPAKLMGQMVDYCAASVPSLSEELRTDSAAAFAKFSVAMEPFLEELSTDPEFSAPVRSDVVAEFHAIGELMLADVRKLDPEVYCSNLVLRMRDITIDEIRSSIEESYRQYMSAGSGTNDD